jgi:hypothetical protein
MGCITSGRASTRGYRSVSSSVFGSWRARTEVKEDVCGACPGEHGHQGCALPKVVTPAAKQASQRD